MTLQTVTMQSDVIIHVITMIVLWPLKFFVKTLKLSYSQSYMYGDMTKCKANIYLIAIIKILETVSIKVFYFFRIVDTVLLPVV